MNVTTEEINQVIQAVNASHGTNYKLVNRFEKGEWGAYRIAEPGKQPVVLKFFTHLSNTNVADPDPELAKQITDRLLALGYPVPKYLYTGSLDGGLYWVQQELPGEPLWADPTVEQVERILSFLLLQRDQAVSEKQNYSLLVRDTVFGNRFGNVQLVKAYSSEANRFMEHLMLFVKDLESLPLPTTDIVHGDFSYHQVMVDDGEITGVIDWQEAGCGDWLVDLTRLIYSLHDRPHLTAPILKHITDKDLPKIRLLTVYTAIEMLSWPIRQNRPNLEGSFNKARSAADFVFARDCSY